ISGITGQFFRQFALTIAVSTLISAFNSLTLSPALTGLLLRPRPVTGASEDVDLSRPATLPRLAYVLIGGWLGWEYLTAMIETIGLAAWSPEFAGYACAAAGATVGLLVSRPLDWILGVSFQAFNRGFNWATNGYTRMVGSLLRVSVVVLIVYGGLLGLTY